MFAGLWSHLTKRRKLQFFFLIALTLLSSIFEVVSIGAILPFLGVLTDPEYFYNHDMMRPAVHFFEIANPDQLLLPSTVIFIFAILFAAIIRLMLLYVSTRISYAIGADLSINIYRRTLYQDYQIHTLNNSSDIINGVINKTTSVAKVVQAYITMVSSTVLIIFIMTTLFVIDPNIALISLLAFGSIYFLVVIYTRKKLESNSRCIAERSTQVVKALQEGLGGIRDVLIGGTQEFYCNVYRRSDIPVRRASGNNIVIGSSPRHIIEALGMTLIAILAYNISLQDDGLSVAIPTLGALAIGAQRLLPALQQTYSSYVGIKGSKTSFEDVLKMLEQELPDYACQVAQPFLSFENEIILKNISFRYSKHTPWVLRDINLKIVKGSIVGFVGVTGSGKSTLVDIIMGLLTATEGELVIDNNSINNKNKRSWQTHISHVPQSIYLSDGTIEENIAFGTPVDKIDRNRVRKAAKQAQISGLIEEWKDGYKTNVGERGVRMSGGQRQRIGIARALYQQADVLIFDEATSALDNKTEKEVMKSIHELDEELTILIIAHRITTLTLCDQIVQLDKNYNINIGSYNDVIGH